MRVFTIGHSTHPIDEFVAILKAHDITKIIDIRTIAKSRHNPQYAEIALRNSLSKEGLGYARLEKLGGLRPTNKDSINTAWRNKSFRGYADYMQTKDFLSGLSKLIDEAASNHVAIMCAEAVPWRCHRSLVGDALVVRNIEVLDIINEKPAKPHTLTSFALVDGHTVSYPDEA